MNEDVFIVAIVFGSGLAILGMIYSLINNWIRSKSSAHSAIESEEFLDALREFKENMERRVANLEAIVADEESSRSSSKSGEGKKKTQRAIELELDDEPTQKEEGSESSKLRNMLNQ